MKSFFNISPNDETCELRSPFVKLLGDGGKEYKIEQSDSSYIIFMVSGEVEVLNNKNAIAVMKPNHMYSLCKLCSPFSINAFTDFTCLILFTDALVKHVNARMLTDILSTKSPLCDGLPELPYNKVFESYVQNILLINDCRELMPDSFYDIKKSEFLHYMASMYTHEQIVYFAYGIVSTYSEFKRGVYSKYTNTTNVEYLASSMFMTTKTFTRNFKKEFNMTPNDWILEQKLFNIKHYIVNNGMSVPQLLKEFEFSSVSALRQFLKRHDQKNLLIRLGTSKN